MKRILAIILLTFPSIAYLDSQLPKPIVFIAKLSNIEFNRTAIDAETKLILADRFHFSNPNPCNTRILSANNKSFGISLDEYYKKLEAIKNDALNDKYIYVTIDQCDKGGMPMITNILPCTDALCGAEHMVTETRIWLGDDYLPTTKRQASYYVDRPLVRDEASQLWKVQGWFIEAGDSPQKHVAFEGFTDDQTLNSARFISSFKSFYISGNPSTALTYNKEGKHEGEYVSYYDEKGKIFETVSYRNGLLEGEHVVYHSNGKLENRNSFSNGKNVDGECLHYYDDGSLHEKHSYLNGKLEGKAFSYYPDQKIQAEETYHVGKSVGKQLRYFASGKVERESNFDQQGESDGISQSFTEEGKPRSKSVYEHGTLRSSEQWYANGNKQTESFYNKQGQEQGITKSWYENGRLEKSYSYKNGLLDGSSKTWNAEGYLTSDYPHKAGKIDGEVNSYDELGKRIRTNQYKNGNQNGMEKRWSSDTGKVIEETPYLDDFKHGISKQYNDRTGKLVSISTWVNGKMEGVSEDYDADGISSMRCYHDGKALGSMYRVKEIKADAAKKDPEAQYRLGQYFYSCKDYTVGLKWLNLAAAQNNVQALQFLSNLYSEGDGVTQNAKTAFEYQLKAAETGDSSAQLYIAYFYFEGKGVEKDPKKAFEWNVKSAAQGNADANYGLGYLYRNGIGTDVNIEKAKEHYTFAANAGIAEANAALQQLSEPQQKR